MISRSSGGAPRYTRPRPILAVGAAVGVVAALVVSTVVAVRYLPASRAANTNPVGASLVSTVPASSALVSSVPVVADISVEYDGASAPPARQYLRHLAAAVISAPADADSGRFAFIHLTRWAADSTMRSGQPATIHTVVFDEKRWRAADGSGRVQTTREPDQPAGQPVTTSENYPAGRLEPGTDPISTEPALMASMIDSIQPWIIGPNAGLRGINDLNGWHYLNRDHRVAALQVLTSTDGLIWRGHTTDRAERPGVAVSYDTATSRDLLIIDEHTGELLAYILITRGGHKSGHVELYELYEKHGRTSAPA